MQTLYDTLSDDNFVIVAVDLNESRNTVQEFIDQYEYTYPVLLDTNGSVGAVYGARSIPTSFLIDEEGNALGFLVGSREWDGDDVLRVFRSLLAD